MDSLALIIAATAGGIVGGLLTGGLALVKIRSVTLCMEKETWAAANRYYARKPQA